MTQQSATTDGQNSSQKLQTRTLSSRRDVIGEWKSCRFVHVRGHWADLAGTVAKNLKAASPSRLQDVRDLPGFALMDQLDTPLHMNRCGLQLCQSLQLCWRKLDKTAEFFRQDVVAERNAG